MRAVLQTKQTLTVQEIDRPTPGENEVLVRVHAATVTRGDVIMRNMPRIAYLPLSLFGMRYKPTPGHEFAGVVEAVGQAVTRFKVGDAVLGTTTGLRAGANAEYVVVPESWKSGVIVHKPAALAFEDAAALPIGGMTAHFLLDKANIQPGECMLVYGASGSVGSYAVQLAKHMGAVVTAVYSTRNVNLVRSLGADDIIDYKTEDFAARGDTYDVIVDAVGKTTRAQRAQSLAADGRVVSVRSVTKENAAALTQLADLAAAGTIRPVIDRCYALDQINEAYEHVVAGRKVGNVVVQVVDSEGI
ncbi:MAG: NAD(P)-dependent alcohol dehydrogenase [Chloroflexota bacterium]